MAGAGVKAKGEKRRDSHRLPADAERLLRLILDEIRAPADMQKVLDGLPPVESCVEEARAFLKAKDRAGRREDFIRNERLWFNKYGWMMARVATYFGLLVFVLFFAVRGMGVDFLTALILGAAGYYVLLVTFSNLRYRDKNKKRRKLLDAEAHDYQRRLVKVAASLLKRFGVEAERYPVENPRTPAGLEQRAEGYFIPLD